MKATPSIIILTGAGISAESGIRTFRDSNGLWENHAIEDVATPEAYFRNPTLVHSFYNARRAQLLEPHIKPNRGHSALAELEAKWPGEFLLVTQNVDNLHERAGSKNMIHMHGELLKVRCLKSQNTFSWNEEINSNTKCECCLSKSTLRPDIVWFGEIPYQMDQIYHALDRCDLFVAIGTSGAVYPAAGFVDYVRGKAHTVEINLDESANYNLFDETLKGPASVEVPKFVSLLLEKYA